MRDFNFPASGPVNMDIRLPIAHVEIRATDGSDIEVQLVAAEDHPRAAELLDRVEVRHDSGTLTVADPDARGLRSLFAGGRNNWTRLKVTIDVPTGTAGDLRIGTGNVRCIGEYGRVDIKCGQGDVTVDRLAGGKVKAGAGTVRIDRALGAVDIATGAGDIDLAHAALDATLKSGSGSVTIGSVQSGKIAAKTGMGEIRVGVPEGVALQVDVKSGLGTVDNRLTTAADRPEAQSYVTFSAASGMGNIIIERPTAVAGS